VTITSEIYECRKIPYFVQLTNSDLKWRKWDLTVYNSVLSNLYDQIFTYFILFYSLFLPSNSLLHLDFVVIFSRGISHIEIIFVININANLLWFEHMSILFPYWIWYSINELLLSFSFDKMSIVLFIPRKHIISNNKLFKERSVYYSVLLYLHLLSDKL
jgi:hypothetical protein